MAVRLDINANVRGASQVNRLNRAVGTLAVRTTRASTSMAALEVAAARGRASMALLATTLNVAVLGALAAVTFGLSRFVRATFDTGDLIEGLGIRFELLFGSVEEGGRAFEALADFAARVPFSLADIAAGSGNLAVVSKDAEDLGNILEITGNVAAATGLDFRQTAEQIQRAFAGGIAAADVFRERGVRAMLGFESGVTVSIEETVSRFEEVFSGNGRFARATELLAETLQGQLSLVDDAFFSFRRSVADTFFSQLTGQVRGLVEDIAVNSEQITIIAQRIGSGLGAAFIRLEEIGRSLIKNFSSIVAGIKAIVAFKLVGIIGGIIAAMAQWTIGIIATSVQFGILNAIMRANPVGLVITAIQLLVAGFIFFREEISGATQTALEFVNRQFLRLRLRVLKLIEVLNYIPGIDIDVSNAVNSLESELAISIAKVTGEITKVNDEFREANEILRSNAAYELGSLETLEQQVEAAAAIRDAKLIILNAQKEQVELEQEQFRVNRENARQNMEALGTYTNIREILEDLNITSSLVGNNIADTWIKGLREGASLSNIIRNSFRNLLQTLADTLLRQSINLAVERIFNKLAGERLRIEKSITNERTKQSLASSASGGGSLLSTITGFFGFNKGGIVPGGAPYTDRVPALLTPGERVIPRGEVNNNSTNRVVNNTINISGNVDQRSIDQIRSVIASSAGEVGGANKDYTRNTAGLKSRRR